MAASNFMACFDETESFEGGYVNNPHDPGGATLKGVTQGAYNAWRVGRKEPVRGDDLFVGLDLVMVDYGWGSGPVTAIRRLQRVLGVASDGQFGLETLGAVRAAQGAGLINHLCDDRTRFFQSLTTWVYFGRGWMVRLSGIRAKALAMNAAAK